MRYFFYQSKEEEKAARVLIHCLVMRMFHNANMYVTNVFYYVYLCTMKGHGDNNKHKALLFRPWEGFMPFVLLFYW